MATLEEFYVRLYPGNEAEEAIAEYLAQFEKGRQGLKHDKAKELMALGLRALREDDSSDLGAIRQIVREEVAQATPSLDRDAVRGALRQAMRDAANEGEGPDFTLSDIRQVVSVVLRQQLDELEISEMTSGDGDSDVNEPPADAEAEKILDRLGDSLMQ